MVLFICYYRPVASYVINLCFVLHVVLVNKLSVCFDSVHIITVVTECLSTKSV
jgi:hypothetical protein